MKPAHRDPLFRPREILGISEDGMGSGRQTRPIHLPSRERNRTLAWQWGGSPKRVQGPTLGR